ncbi:MAG: hypothetical protein FJX52_10265, partial [Alphaproteobacteria bacterium]|nr:hypothetical protein [Alphaproteobacteria bacterium]
MADRVPGDRLGLWPPLSLMTAVQFSVTMATVTMAAIAPVVAATLDLPPSFIGYQVSLIYSGGATMSLFGGSAVRRYGACLVSQLALLVAVAGCALLATGW